MYKVACLLIVALLGVVYAVPSQYDNKEVWVAGNLSIPLPSNTLVGGADQLGYKLYVGRVIFAGTIVPCHVVAETGVASCATEAVHFSTTTYELLTTQDNKDYEWIHSYDGHLEENAISVGTTNWNERVFICRAQTDGGVIIGSLMLTKKVCFLHDLSYDYVHRFDKYEVLVANPKNNETYY